MTTPTRRTPGLGYRGLATLFLGVIVSAGIWSSFTDRTVSEVALIPCPVHAVTGIDCPGCGITRGSVALIRGDFGAAWNFHPFAYFLVPLALLFLLVPTETRSTWKAIPKGLRQVVTALALVSCLALWVSRAF